MAGLLRLCWQLQASDSLAGTQCREMSEVRAKPHLTHDTNKFTQLTRSNTQSRHVVTCTCTQSCTCTQVKCSKRYINLCRRCVSPGATGQITRMEKPGCPLRTPHSPLRGYNVQRRDEFTTARAALHGACLSPSPPPFARSLARLVTNRQTQHYTYRMRGQLPKMSK